MSKSKDNLQQHVLKQCTDDESFIEDRKQLEKLVKM